MFSASSINCTLHFQGIQHIKRPMQLKHKTTNRPMCSRVAVLRAVMNERQISASAVCLVLHLKLLANMRSHKTRSRVMEEVTIEMHTQIYKHTSIRSHGDSSISESGAMRSEPEHKTETQIQCRETSTPLRHKRSVYKYLMWMNVIAGWQSKRDEKQNENNPQMANDIDDNYKCLYNTDLSLSRELLCETSATLDRNHLNESEI